MEGCALLATVGLAPAPGEDLGAIDSAGFILLPLLSGLGTGDVGTGVDCAATDFGAATCGGSEALADGGEGRGVAGLLSGAVVLVVALKDALASPVTSEGEDTFTGCRRPRLLLLPSCCFTGALLELSDSALNVECAAPARCSSTDAATTPGALARLSRKNSPVSSEALFFHLPAYRRVRVQTACALVMSRLARLPPSPCACAISRCLCCEPAS